MKDVVWISLESIRQDHTSVASPDSDTTPFLQSLADNPDGQYFTSCYSHDNWTRGAIASLFTGKASSDHRTWHPEAKLPEEIPSVIEKFSDQGYRTVGTTQNPQISRQTGLARGFDAFTYLNPTDLYRKIPLRDAARYLRAIRHHSAGVTFSHQEHCFNYLNYLIGKREIERAGRHEDDSLFLFLHLGDSHHPYCPPLPWRRTYEEAIPGSSSDAVAQCLSMTENVHGLIGGDGLTSTEHAQVTGMYDAGIAYTDSLCEQLAALAIRHLEDPIIAIVGDHGELFGEERLYAHMLTTNRAVSHIPAATLGLDIDAPSSTLIQPIDIMNRIASVCGVDYPETVACELGARDVAFVQRSRERGEHKKSLIAQHGGNASQYVAAEETAAITDEYRITYHDGEVARYSAVDDVTPISDVGSGTVPDSLEEHLRKFVNANTRMEVRDSKVEFDKGMQDHLRNLGYL